MSKKVINVGINGFGRIGRATFKIGLKDKRLNFVGINDLTDPHILAHLLKYDSVYGRFEGKVKAVADGLVVNGKHIPVFAEPEPRKIPWKKVGTDVVIESTGFFTDGLLAAGHLKAGAKKVIITAPPKGEDVKIFLRGVNAKDYQGEKVISNGSCTTNCVAPVLAALMANFGVEKAMMSTVHAYTSGQNLVDGPPPARKKDMLDGRAAGLNIVPTSTGAAKAVTRVLPALAGKFTALGIHVPVATGSVIDLVVVTSKNTTPEKVNAVFRRAVKNPAYQGALAVSEEPLVSTDIIGAPHSAIVDLSFTQVEEGNLVRVLAWYDNEWGYAAQLVKQVAELGG